MDTLFKLESNETFTQVLKDIWDHLYDSKHMGNSEILDAAGNQSVKESIKDIILETNLDKNKVSELLRSKFNDDAKVEIFLAMIDKKNRDLINSVTASYAAMGTTLRSCDWQLKLVCGLNDLHNLTQPLVQLAFYTVDKNHETHRTIQEFNKPMLLQLIGNIEQYVDEAKRNHGRNEE